MSKQAFYDVLTNEIGRVDAAHVAKRHEKIIEGFGQQTKDAAPKALIQGKEYSIFNSNDYLGLRFHPSLREAEEAASKKYGTGPGAVRFISGTLQVHRDLEEAVAKFHSREAGMVFSSAFATNMAVLFCLIKGQSADSLVDGNVLVISDELNHRSIIDGIRIANLPKEQRAIFKHMDPVDLVRVLNENQGKFKRVIVVTDGVFSMLGEYQDLKKINEVIASFDAQYEQGVILVVDDCHGIGAFGETGRGCEEVSQGKADVLVGTFGKALGSDGGYVVGDKVVIDYLRESAATYIYSNSISPGTAASAFAAVHLLKDQEGEKLLRRSRDNVAHFQKLMKAAGFSFAAESIHPIQPLLIGDTAKTKQLKEALFEAGILVTNINYPVVPKGRDEIRVQISAAHSSADIETFVEKCTEVGKQLSLI
jgi:glycine C-acetyltransferase